MLEIFNKKNLILFLSFFLITFVFINFTHNHFQSFELIQNNTYKKLNNFEFKQNINTKLTSEESYQSILDRKCIITGDMHDRHKVRWVKSLFLKNIFQLAENINSNSPYYLNILLHSMLIFLSLLILNLTFNLKTEHIIFFLLYVTFIFQNYLGEYSYSIFEMFFCCAAFYASKRKNIFLFSLILLLSVLNRESGFILAISWLFFNDDLKKIITCLVITLIIFVLLNFKILDCIINPKFFIPLENQEGQVNLSNLEAISFYSLIKVLMINFIIPFGIITFNVIKNKIINKYFILFVLTYLFVFLIATPLHHMAVKLIILPIIILSFQFHEKNKINEF